MRFRLVDKVIAWSRNDSLVAEKAVSFEEYSLRSAMASDERLPESLAMGAMLEAASWLTILSSDFAELAWPEEIGLCELHACPRPGERMLISAQLIGREASLLRFRILAAINDVPAIVMPLLTARAMPLHEFLDPADFRTLFSEIGPRG